MLRPGASRYRLARTLNTAYADGLLSEKTLSHRLDELFGSRLVDPRSLVGDLSWRGGSGWRAWARDAVAGLARTVRSAIGSAAAEDQVLLALDWGGGHDEILIGRHACCDVVLSDPEVSRRHARLRFRDGTWVLQDLESTNGTTVNGVRVGRCELRPGDHLAIGNQQLQID